MDKAFRLYDNGGATADRYTLVFMACEYSRADPKLREAFGFNAHPTHPQGYGQHVGAMPGAHLGKRIEVEDLPDTARPTVERLIREDEEARTYTLTRTRIEVPAPRKGRPGYAWRDAYFVTPPGGQPLSPPAQMREARALVRQLGGPLALIVVKD